jgi:hypothetical protein
MFVTDGDQNIWRIKPTAGASPVLFANSLNSPLGLSLIDTGVMLVSENGSLTVIDGWRFKFKRGDANKDLLIDLSDVISIANWLFVGGPEPTCWDAADANDDGRINLTDAIFLALYFASGGPPPPAPGPTTLGADPTGDLFGCRQYHSSGEITW